MALKYSDLVSYITVHDKKNMERYYGILKKNSLIIPVTFIRTAGECEYSNEFLLKIKKTQQDCRRKIIFTASFDFFPNIDAANKIIEKAHENPDLLFILAGRKINLLNLPETSNVVLFDSLNNNEMDKLLSGSDIFYSPLVMGSGMKTKIAEALSHGLYIYATRHTMIGYDDVMYDNKCVRVITDANESFPDFIKKSPFDKEYIRSAHNKYYSYDRFSGNELNLF
ncbi:glycosyltransferase [Citrobacter sedlakii]|uniref:glycosyltransferase n=1 Tax=Citrobacter sedlakii TaxID=67826 RepID=UPI00388E0C2E